MRTSIPTADDRFRARPYASATALAPRSSAGKTDDSSLAPCETAGDWWTASGFDVFWGDQEMDAMEHFLHDLPSTVLQEALERGEPEQTGRVMTEPFPLPALPAITTRGIAATNDRFFPVAFMDRLIRDRLGVEPEHVAAGHLPALANPVGLVELLLA